MQTLSAHNQFAPAFGVPSFYRANSSIEFQREAVRTITRRGTYDSPDKTCLEAQQRPESIIDSVSDQRRPCEESVPSQVNSTSCGVPLSTQPPRANSPAVFAPECDYVETLPIPDEDSPDREYFMRCVMIGADNTGKHTLISSNFAEETRKASNESDLIMKKAVSYKTTKKYHFWVRSLGDNSETKEAIWKSYYKSAHAFVFVYDTTNKESFEALETAVKSVLEVVPQEKFHGVLIGTKNDMYEQRAVDYDEVVDFKYKYNLRHFIETCSSNERETPQMLPRLDTKLKLTFESI